MQDCYTLVLTTCGGQGSWPSPLPAAAFPENGPRISPGQHSGVDLLTEMWVNRPKTVSMRDMALSLICRMMWRAEERCSPPTRWGGGTGPEILRVVAPHQLQHSGEWPTACWLRVGELNLRACEPESLLHSLSITERGELAVAMPGTHSGPEDRGELVGWPALQLPRPRPMVVSWLTSISRPSVIGWSIWSGWSCRPKASGSPQHRATIVYPKGVPVKTQDRECLVETRDLESNQWLFAVNALK